MYVCMYVMQNGRARSHCGSEWQNTLHHTEWEICVQSSFTEGLYNLNTLWEQIEIPSFNMALKGLEANTIFLFLFLRCNVSCAVHACMRSPKCDCSSEHML